MEEWKIGRMGRAAGLLPGAQTLRGAAIQGQLEDGGRLEDWEDGWGPARWRGWPDSGLSVLLTLYSVIKVLTIKN
jgi:hypothetical protein